MGLLNDFLKAAGTSEGSVEAIIKRTLDKVESGINVASKTIESIDKSAGKMVDSAEHAVKKVDTVSHKTGKIIDTVGEHVKKIAD